MNWKSLNFDWNRARAFLVAAEEGTFSAAAKALNISQPTLGRQVSALEAEMGVALFEKVGKTLELTSSGLDLVEHVRAMAEAANQFSLTASGRGEALEGKVTISASEAYAAYALASVLKTIREQWPGIVIEVIATNEVSDLKRREADIAIRNFRPKGQDLIARRLNDARAALYASPAYLESLESPITLASLSKATYIGFPDLDAMVAMFKHQIGIEVTFSSFPIITKSHLAHWEFVKEGLGIGVMPIHIGETEPKVQRVLESIPPIQFENWLVTHREVKTNKRVRLVYDLLFDEFQRITSVEG